MSKKENVKGLSKVLTDSRGMNELLRWPGAHMMGQRKPNVAEHTIGVSQSAIMLAKIEENEFGTVVDWKRLFTKCIGHDMPEVYTGDVKGPLKHNYPDIKRSVDQAEVDMTNEELCRGLSPKYAESYLTMLTNGKDGTTEGDILAASDSIDQVMETLAELRVNNPHPTFLIAYKAAVCKLRKSSLGSVKLFLEVTLQELLENIDGKIDIRKVTHDILNEPLD